MSDRAKAMCWACLFNMIGGGAVLLGAAMLTFATLRYFHL